MSKVIDTLWKIEPHTQVKHEILRRYLGAWFAILGPKNSSIMYLDGFCGPGRYSGGEDGSPIIALKEAIKQEARLKNTKVVFFFIDQDIQRIEHLQQEVSLLNVPSNFTVIIQAGEFEQVLDQIFQNARQKRTKLVPIFAFIDPFGFKGVPFELIQQLLSNPHSEVFVNVMIDFINRFIEHPDPQTQQHIIDLFGTTQAVDVIQKASNRFEALRRLYLAQLQRYAKFVRYFEMRNDRDRVLYYLFFATKHRLGHVKIKEVFWAVDRSSGFKFSDTTNPSQFVLFHLDPSKDLAQMIVERFQSQTVGVEEVQVFVENKTPYIASHMRNALNYLEEEGQVYVSPCKSDGSKRRKKTWPSGIMLKFK